MFFLLFRLRRAARVVEKSMAKRYPSVSLMSGSSLQFRIEDSSINVLDVAAQLGESSCGCQRRCPGERAQHILRIIVMVYNNAVS